MPDYEDKQFLPEIQVFSGENATFPALFCSFIQ
jgi:hypothetical protein